MKRLHISDDLSLPLDVVTQTIAILAKRRVGKSYLMRRIVEQLFKAGQQVILVDPKGDQWGIRSAADGKGPGLPFVILGGERGDVPIEAAAGAVVAKMLVEERVSAVLDLSLFRKREVAEFMGGPTPPRGHQEGFLEVLYRMKAQERYRTPVMLVLDEGDAIAPQNPSPGEERMLGAAEDIVRRGGQRGLGCIVVTQRSAVLNKNVLTQSEILIALRTISPQDLKAMKAWIDVHGEPEQRETLMASLPSLPTGDAWVWSPGWPTGDGIFQRIHTLPIETFDSAATPKPGERRVEPKTVADVDLEALRVQMAETIERAKENDPAELKKQLAEAKRLLAAKERTLQQIDEQAKRIDSTLDRVTAGQATQIKAEAKREARAAWEPLLKERDATIRELHGQLRRVVKLLDKAHAVQDEMARELGTELPKLTAIPESEPLPVAIPPRREMPVMHRAAPAPNVSGNGRTDTSLPEGERVVLIAIAQHHDGVTREQVTILTGYKRSTRDAYIQRLRGRSYVALVGDVVVGTREGIAALGSSFEPLPTGEALREYWRAKLPEGERRVFEVVIDAYPAAVSRDVVSDRTGYKRSTRDAYAQRLTTRRLIAPVGRGELRANDTLFEERR